MTSAGASQVPDASIAVDEAVLREQIGEILAAWGFAERPVRSAVDALVWADLRGVHSHGIAMIPIYERWLKAGRFDLRSSPRQIHTQGALALVDGGSGLGFEPARWSMERAVELAKSHGIGAVAVRRSNHFGAAGHWAEQASRAGLIGLALTSTVSPAIVPTGGRAARLGTNPIAFAAPGTNADDGFLLDMATSTVALGKLMVAALRGDTIPIGWALGRDGQPTSDPREGYESRLATPVGALPVLSSHKGYGLAVMVEVLTAVLAGATLALDEGGDVPQGDVGHFFLALDPGGFGVDGRFQSHLARLLAGLRSTPSLDPDMPVQVAGDPERAALRSNRASGVPLPQALMVDVRAVCARAGCRFVLH
jgi:LDH2 family malate/lactate/ureidoglycolate dehydrogenase